MPPIAKVLLVIEIGVCFDNRTLIMGRVFECAAYQITDCDSECLRMDRANSG